MKKIIALTAALMAAFGLTALVPASASAKVIEANLRVRYSLVDHFNGASDVTWYSMDQGNYEATFRMNGAKETAYFNDHGRLLLTTRSLDLAGLPMAASIRLAECFPGYYSRFVTERSNQEGTFYVVNLEGIRDWKTVEFSARGIRVIETIQKA